MFGHRSSRVWLWMIATAIAQTTIAYADAPRGVYWNDALAPTAGAEAALDSLGARRIHIWLNDQPSKHGVTCDGFKYTDWWKGRDIGQFVHGLRSAGYDVVLTISPYARSNAYIDSQKCRSKLRPTIRGSVLSTIWRLILRTIRIIDHLPHAVRN